MNVMFAFGLLYSFDNKGKDSKDYNTLQNLTREKETHENWHYL